MSGTVVDRELEAGVNQPVCHTPTHTAKSNEADLRFPDFHSFRAPRTAHPKKLGPLLCLQYLLLAEA